MSKNHTNKYRIENKFLKEFKGADFIQSDDSFVFIADFTRRTKSVRGVEIYRNQVPDSPGTPLPMEGFTVLNPEHQVIFFAVFQDESFIDKDGNQIQHAEGTFFPMNSQDNCWIAFLEIKDCKPGNISGYNSDIRDKMLNCKNQFLTRKITTVSNRYYGIASFPRKKLEFDDSCFNDVFTQKELLDQTGILFFAANRIVINKDVITPEFD